MITVLPAVVFALFLERAAPSAVEVLKFTSIPNEVAKSKQVQLEPFLMAQHRNIEQLPISVFVPVSVTVGERSVLQTSAGSKIRLSLTSRDVSGAEVLREVMTPQAMVQKSPISLTREGVWWVSHPNWFGYAQTAIGQQPSLILMLDNSRYSLMVRVAFSSSNSNLLADMQVLEWILATVRTP